MPQFNVGDIVRLTSPDHFYLLPHDFRHSTVGRLYPPTLHEFIIVNITENGDDGVYSGITLASFERPDLFQGGGGLYYNPNTDNYERSWAVRSYALELVSSTRASRIGHKPKRDFKRSYVF